jgi:putative transposase
MESRRCRKDGTVLLGKAYRLKLQRLVASNGSAARVRARAQILLLSDRGWDRVSIVEATGTSTATVSRIRGQYVASGLNAALTEKPRPGIQRKLSERQVQQVVAIACSEPPEGYARWSVRLLTEEVKRKGLADVPIGRECIRVLLRDHDLKPWREKNVVHPGADR